MTLVAVDIASFTTSGQIPIERGMRARKINYFISVNITLLHAVALISCVILPRVGAAKKTDPAPAPQAEVKVTVDPRQTDRLRDAFGLTGVVSESENVYYVDSLDQDLYRQGIIIRVRHRETGDDVIVKLRPMTNDTRNKFSGEHNFSMQYDRTPRGETLSGEIKEPMDGKLFAQILAEDKKGKHLLTDAQRELLTRQISDRKAGRLQVSVLGPFPVERWKRAPWTVERWRLPDQSQIVEVSKVVDATLADRTLAEIQQTLLSKGLAASDVGLKTPHAISAAIRAKCIVRQLTLKLKSM